MTGEAPPNVEVLDVARKLSSGTGSFGLDRYFVLDGKPVKKPFKAKPVPSEKPTRHLEELTVVSNFVEVFLAKEGHSGRVGINYLTKIQLPTLPSLFGALLAGVDYVLMGAGITVAFAINRDLTLAMPISGVLGSIGAALAVGSLAGLYPAIRAARIEPAEAVRTG